MTPRLALRPFEIGWERAVYDLVLKNHDRLIPWMPWAKEPSIERTAEFVANAAEAWQARKDLAMAIFERGENRLVGAGGLHRINWTARTFEIGYWIDGDYEGKGLVTEMSLALTRFCFEKLEARRVEIRCDPRNRRSAAVPQRLGFEHEGTLRKIMIGPDGESVDLEIHARVDSQGLPPLSYETPGLN